VCVQSTAQAAAVLVHVNSDGNMCLLPLLVMPCLHRAEAGCAEPLQLQLPGGCSMAAAVAQWVCQHGPEPRVWVLLLAGSLSAGAATSQPHACCVIIWYCRVLLCASLL
jgi:hypothetical protein